MIFTPPCSARAQTAGAKAISSIIMNHWVPCSKITIQHFSVYMNAWSRAFMKSSSRNIWGEALFCVGYFSTRWFFCSQCIYFNIFIYISFKPFFFLPRMNRTLLYYVFTLFSILLVKMKHLNEIPCLMYLPHQHQHFFSLIVALKYIFSSSYTLKRKSELTYSFCISYLWWEPVHILPVMRREEPLKDTFFLEKEKK